MSVTVAVVGGGDAPAHDREAAEAVGRALAEAGATVVCGGLGGVMEAVCRGARSAGGVTVGLLPGTDRRAANSYVAVAIPTGLGEVRNALVVAAADAVIAIGGEYGTLSEIALALRASKPVIGLNTWTLTRPGATTPDSGIVVVQTPEDAVAEALNRVGPSTASS